MVDDDAEDRDILQYSMDAIEQSDIVIFAENGEVALDMLNKNFHRNDVPRLIILDLNMPGLNGTETLRALKRDSRFKDIPVIIYSTSINPFEKDACMKLGADSFITKPISLQESMDNAAMMLRFL
jgi:CheY-like chemotaxis protein